MNTPANARIVDLDSAEIAKLYPAEIADSNRCLNECLTLNRLSLVLQTSIEIPQILRLFYQEVERLQCLKGLAFVNDQHQCRFDYGDVTERSSRYRLQTDSDYLGDLTIYHQDKEFPTELLMKLDRLVPSLAFPLRNGLRYHDALRASLTDGLTGTGNRIFMDSVLKQEIEQASRYRRPLSILALDLDHFKSINDTYGHGVGDTVLRTLADTIKAASRGADTVFRYGGEEFVILLSNTDVAGAKVTAERMRKAIEKMAIYHDNSLLKITASIGAASLCHSESKESLMERADLALYEAKARGRNRVKFAEPTLAHA